MTREIVERWTVVERKEELPEGGESVYCGVCQEFVAPENMEGGRTICLQCRVDLPKTVEEANIPVTRVRPVV